MKQVHANVTLPPCWEAIESHSEYCRSLCDELYGDRTFAFRLQVVVQELLENGVKYSMDKEDGVVGLSLMLSENEFCVSVKNAASAHDREELLGELEQLKPCSAEEGFLSVVRRAANTETPKSRMGLAKVRLEGAAEIEVTADSNGVVTVTGRGKR